MDSQRTLIKSLSSDLKDQREELEVAKRLVSHESFNPRVLPISPIKIIKN